MFIAAQFTTAKKWNQPRSPSMNDWIQKIYINAMEYYSAIKRNEKLVFFATKWVYLETTMLSEISEHQKDKQHMFSLM